MLVFFLCGLCHGACLTFVGWGLYHGLFLVLERTRFGKMQEKIPRLFRHFYMVFVVMMGWVIFRAATFAAAGDYFHALFLSNHLPAAQPLARYATNEAIWAITFGILFSGPLWNWIQTCYAKLEQALPAADRPVVQLPWAVFEILLIIILLLASSAWRAARIIRSFTLDFKNPCQLRHPIQTGNVKPIYVCSRRSCCCSGCRPWTHFSILTIPASREKTGCWPSSRKSSPDLPALKDFLRGWKITSTTILDFGSF